MCAQYYNDYGGAIEEPPFEWIFLLLLLLLYIGTTSTYKQPICAV